jgi:two-component system, OmpR family, sensor histidine kinase VicK
MSVGEPSIDEWKLRGLSNDRLTRFFMQAPAGICILDGPDMVFELVNPQYQQFFPNRALLGKPILNALPELRDHRVWEILQDVYTTGKPFEGKELLVPLARTTDGPIEDRYFDFTYQARLDEKGKIDGILVFVIEVTDSVLAKHKIEEREGNLRSLVMTARNGLLILRGPDMIVEVFNRELENIWSRPASVAVGRPLLEILPELKGQQFPALLQQVYTTGQGVSLEEQELVINIPSGTKRTYVSFSYDPLLDNKGKVSGIIVSAEDVTYKVKAKKSFEQDARDQQLTNDVLSASNEQLETINQELMEMEDRLRDSVDELGESEYRFRLFIQQAPVAIFILRGREMVIETINQMMLKMLGKTSAIIGKTYAEALPEFEGQPFFKLLDDVFTSGEPYVGNEIKAAVEYAGELREGYYNFIYQPIIDDQARVNSVICTAVDVTEQVNARKKVERAEESLRMAIDAAELGAYYINAADRIFVASPRLKEFFGFAPDEEVPYDAAINQIHPDYRQAAADLVEAAFTQGVRFDMEYPVIGHNDGKTRWVRGIGTVQHDSTGKNSYFTGVLHEITERKQDEIRKNDFISMVSHELKTPLTSLTAIVQMLNLQLQDSKDEFIPNALARAIVQVKRMNTMINGFLNVSLLDSGKIFINVREFDLVALLKEVIMETTLTAPGHPIEFSEGDPAIVDADRDKIGSVIINLLSNAIKYSPEGKKIIVACRRVDGQIVVSVEDQGMGIPAANMEKIFDRFYRVERKNSHQVSGFGIGLYLSAEIIKRHEGRIWATSDTGQGSSFYFSLPAVG